MPTKSIIDIDLNDQSFQRFQQLFSRYQEQLSSTPGLWAKAGKEQEEIAGHFQSMTASLMAIAQLHREGAEDTEKQNKTLSLSERLWTSIGRSTKDVAKNVLGATSALLKWTGLLGAVSGLLGAGGLWGIDRMAGSVGNERRSSSGLGLSIGQQKAFGQSLGRIIDPSAFLGWVNSMELDISKAGPAYALQGGRGLSGNTSNDALSLLDAIRAKGKTLPLGQLQTVLKGYGLDMDDESVRRLTDPSKEKEYQQLRASFLKDSQSENIDDKTAKGWQDFTEQLQKAGSEIFKTFVEGLAPLEKPLEHLSAGFTKFVEVLLKSDLVKESIEGMASWLEKFSGHISAPKFLDSVQMFTSDIGDLAQALHGLAHPVDTYGKAGTSFSAGWSNFWSDLWGGGADSSQTSNAKKIAAIQEQQYGLPKGFLSAQIQAESGFNPNAKSSKGAYGYMQLTKETGEDLGVNRYDPGENIMGGAAYDRRLLNRYNGDLAEALAAYNWGPSNVDSALGKYGKDWFQHAPTETQNYVTKLGGRQGGVDINIYNQTGGSAVVTASGLAH